MRLKNVWERIKQVNLSRKTLISLSLVILILFVISEVLFIKHDSDTIARYIGGSVDRKTFYALINRFSRGNPLLRTDENRQRRFLKREILAPAITTLEAERTGLTYSQSVMSKVEELKNRYLRGVLYRRKVLDVGFKEKAVKARQIFFKVERFKKNKKGENEALSREQINNQYSNLEKTAQEVINKIKNGELTFEKAIKIYGDKKAKVELGWIIEGLNTSSFVKEVMKAEKTGVLPKPISDDFGVHIVEIEDIKTLTPDNIRDVVKDPARRKQILRRIRRRIADEYLEKLYKRNGIEIIRENIFNEASNSVVVKVGEKEYTYSQVINMLKEKYPFLTGKGPIAPDSVISFIEENIIDKYGLLNKDALKQGIHKDPLFVERYGKAKTELIYQEFRQKMRQSMPVSEQEILREYSNQVAYIKSKDKKTKIPPLKKLRPTIEGRLKASKFNAKWPRWIESKFKDYNVKIYDYELWGGVLSRAIGRIKGKGIDIDAETLKKEMEKLKTSLSKTNTEAIDEYDLIWFKYFILNPVSDVCYKAYREFKKLDKPEIELRWLERVSISEDKDLEGMKKIISTGDKTDKMLVFSALAVFKKHKPALDFLIKHYKSETDPDIKAIILSSMGSIGLKSDKAVKLLKNVIETEKVKGIITIAKETLKEITEE